MEVVQLDKTICLSTLIHDPSPHRNDESKVKVSARMLPLTYTCISCKTQLAFNVSDFKRHFNVHHSNLSVEERACIDEYLEKNVTRFNSFLDFYCPGCNCPITILFDGGFSGYGGLFEFEIKDVLSIKS